MQSRQPRRDVQSQSIWGNAAFSDSLPMSWLSLNSLLPATQQAFSFSTAASASSSHSFQFSSDYYLNTNLFCVTCHKQLFHSSTKQSLELPNWCLICTNQIPQLKAKNLNSITASVSQSNKLGELNRDSWLTWMPNTEWLPKSFLLLVGK